MKNRKQVQMVRVNVPLVSRKRSHRRHWRRFIHKSWHCARAVKTYIDRIILHPCIVRHQAFFDTFRLHQLPLPIVTQLYDPPKNLIRPFSFRQQLLWRSAQRPKQPGNLPMMPTDNNLLPLWPRPQFVRQFLKLFVCELLVNYQPHRLAQWRQRQARTFAAFGIRRCVKAIHPELRAIHLIILEILHVSLCTRLTHRCQAIATGRLLRVPDDQNDCTRKSWGILGEDWCGCQQEQAQPKSGFHARHHSPATGNRSMMRKGKYIREWLSPPAVRGSIRPLIVCVSITVQSWIPTWRSCVPTPPCSFQFGRPVLPI